MTSLYLLCFTPAPQSPGGSFYRTPQQYIAPILEMAKAGETPWRPPKERSSPRN